MSTWLQTEAERAFDRAHALAGPGSPRVPAPAPRLPLRAARDRRQRSALPRAARGVREIPLEQITGTLEPHRAAQFDAAFRPAAIVRERWTRVWLAEARGVVLPPISVVPAGDGYAVRDGHHRVSVALAARRASRSTPSSARAELDDLAGAAAPSPARRARA